MTYTDVVNVLVLHKSVVAQWLKHATDVGKVISWIPVGDSAVFL